MSIISGLQLKICFSFFTADLVMLRLALKMLSSGEFFKNFFNLHNFSQISFYSQTHFNNGLENHDK